MGAEARQQLATDLVDTMGASPACVGLAANQIGVDRRALLVDITGHRKARSDHGLIVLFDPEGVFVHGPVVARAGGISVPDLTGDVSPATDVVVQGKTAGGRV